MNEKFCTIDDVNFPPINFYDFIDGLSGDESSLEYEENRGLAYRIWYRKYVINNRPFHRLISFRDHRAVSLFEKIINSREFFLYIILSFEDYKLLKDSINEIFPDRISFVSPGRDDAVLIKNVIIPEKYKRFNKYRIDLFEFLRKNPIKIDFQNGNFLKFDKFPCKKPPCNHQKYFSGKSKRFSSKTYSFRSF